MEEVSFVTMSSTLFTLVIVDVILSRYVSPLSQCVTEGQYVLVRSDAWRHEYQLHDVGDKEEKGVGVGHE